jgi:hypothetical protein
MDKEYQSFHDDIVRDVMAKLGDVHERVGMNASRHIIEKLVTLGLSSLIRHPTDMDDWNIRHRAVVRSMIVENVLAFYGEKPKH